jgi:hypothetical protein
LLLPFWNFSSYVQDKWDQGPPIALPEGYLIKALRTDGNYFGDEFVMGATAATTETGDRYRQILRPIPKSAVTINGKGVWRRKPLTDALTNEPDLDMDVPIKKPQYTAAQKEGFSQIQSTSYGTRNFCPRMFGGMRNKNMPIGVMIPKEDALLSDRLIYGDGGTVNRPYDFDNPYKAMFYFKQRTQCDYSLFASDKLPLFIETIERDSAQPKFNEAMARIRLTPNAYVIIQEGGTLDSRILASHLVTQIEQTLRAQQKPVKRIRIMHYSATRQSRPPSSFVYFRRSKQPNGYPSSLVEYTQQAQDIDRIAALMLAHSPDLRTEAYADNQYAFLLWLPLNMLEERLCDIVQGCPLWQRLLEKKFLYIFDKCLTIMEPLGNIDLLKTFMLQDNIKASVIRYSERRKENSPIQRMWEQILRELEAKLPLHQAIKRGTSMPELDVLLQDSRIDPNERNYIGQAPLHTAVQCNNRLALEKLLVHDRVDPNIRNNLGSTALHLAAGHLFAFKKLLEYVHVNPNIQDNKGNTALSLADVHFCYCTETSPCADFLLSILKHPGIDPELRDNFLKTNAIRYVKRHPAFARELAARHPAFIRELVKHHPDFVRELVERHPDFAYELMAHHRAFACELAARRNPDFGRGFGRECVVPHGQQEQVAPKVTPRSEEENKRAAGFFLAAGISRVEDEESKLGEGSTFIVDIPLQKNKSV